jgi:D-alanyl-D-alanine carboxypeptidase/D-alanyl-D-alanine-endopeptidase (penicillin-binding protein 4)
VQAPCVLSFHENLYSLNFRPANKVGEAATILRTEPPLLTLVLHNEVKNGPEGSVDCACIYGCEFSSLQFVRGTIPCGVNKFPIRGAIPDPVAHCAHLLAKELQDRRVTIEQKNIRQQSERAVVHTTYSPTIAEIVHWTKQKSINLYAEHLLKKMGEVAYNERFHKFLAFAKHRS